MQFKIACAATLSALAAVTAAAPAPPSWGQDTTCAQECMTPQDAQQIAINFQTLITNYSDALADSALAPSFIDYSDSVGELINSGCTGPQPLGEPTFNSLAAFKAGQGPQPSIPFEILNLWSNCNSATLRWRSAQTPELITGIIVLEAVPSLSSNEYAWQIEKVYSEFNSGAWLVNLGVFQPSNCTAETQPTLAAARM